VHNKESRRTAATFGLPSPHRTNQKLRIRHKRKLRNQLLASTWTHPPQKRGWGTCGAWLLIEGRWNIVGGGFR